MKYILIARPAIKASPTWPFRKPHMFAGLMERPVELAEYCHSTCQ